ncbi:GNAT family N-acetyltransferase [Kribbella solani]|uniref:GNAT family N-acetyltransferase n=1 Tax=Kribbella solani TaxID=236067 RepID=UPI0029B3D648|nr:GNAT family N-acetyltransferase [Kribbella solani]MDX2971597.1 GNAT family N-acetyltransferase [Kribbella solani]MDX3000693.1 GNAT family N-acetyltransferase [Kribbella solani]
MRWTGPDGFEADDDVTRVDVDVVHGFLSTSYWAAGISRDVVERSIAGSLNLGVYAADGALVAYARMVTDRTTFAWLADVFVLESHRGHGLGKFVVSTFLEHPELKGIRRFMLATADAHELYRAYGFTEEEPGRLMTIRRDASELYGRQ